LDSGLKRKTKELEPGRKRKMKMKNMKKLDPRLKRKMNR
jgi:hypothetical protein